MVRPFLIAVAVVAATSRAAADSAPAAEKVTPVVVRVRLFSDDPALSVANVSVKVAAELHLEVVPDGSPRAAFATATVTISWRPARGELAVSFSDPSGRTVSRIVDAPKSADAAIAAAVQLAANLAHNEAVDILGPKPTVVMTQIVPPPPASPIVPKVDYVYRPVVATLFAPLSTSLGRTDVRTNFEINFLHGRVAELEGIQLGMSSVATNRADGMQFGFLFSYAKSMSGVQIGGVTSLAPRKVAGLQASWAFNYGGDVDGWQSTFGVNAALGDVNGAQTAAVNVASNLTGLQIGGVNVAKKVRGVQVGFVNVSDEGAVPIGLFNVSNDGGIHPMVWSSWRSYLNVGVKFATRYVYSVVNVSLDYFGAAARSALTSEGMAGLTTVDSGWLLGPGALFGVQFPAGKFRPFIDVGATVLVQPGTLNRPLQYVPEGKIRIGASYEILPRVRPFVGAGVSSAHYRRGEYTISPDLFGGFEF